MAKNFLAQLEAEDPKYWPRGPMAPPNVGELNPTDETTCNVDTNWTRALRWCPQDILDLINSKACRGANESLASQLIFKTFSPGAIMFNDHLDMEQSKRLVWQLSQTMLPFQCAHGRYVQFTDQKGLLMY